MKRFSALLLALCLCLSGVSFRVQAADSEPFSPDPANSWRYENGEWVTVQPFSLWQSTAYHPDATRIGIDVSSHQGEIDWEAVSSAGIDFVMIRCGYGMDQTDQDDPYFEYNASECERLGIPYGVYIYSYATTEERASSEADHVLRLVDGHTLTYPIYFDLEDESAVGSDFAAIAQTFCEKVSAAGYPVGIYANLYWWNNYLTDPCFDSWYRWVAQFNTSCAYTGEYAIWQYSNSGSVSGISGNVDMNYLIGSPSYHGTCAIAHSYEPVVTAPTCTMQGYTTHICFICGHSYVDSYVGVTSHSYSDWETIKDAACTEKGEESHSCTTCGATEKRDVDALGHNFEDGTCTRCGEAEPEVPVVNPFTDVIDGKWYFDAVLWAVDKGVTTGLTPTEFGPNEVCTRAQVVTFLWRAAGQPAPTSDNNPFTDVSDSKYYYDAVLWAVEQGITEGYGSKTTFCPNQECSRAEIVTFLYRTAGNPAVQSANNPFVDVPDGKWYCNAVLWAVSEDITKGHGSDTTFCPDLDCTRAEIVTFLYRTQA